MKATYYEKVRDHVERIAGATTSDAQSIIEAHAISARPGSGIYADQVYVDDHEALGTTPEELARMILKMPEPAPQPTTWTIEELNHRAGERADHQYPPMQHQQWHAVPDANKHGQPSDVRQSATIYSDDERIVCQTHGTWNRGPSDKERPHVLALIATAPELAQRLMELEALVTAAIAAGHWPQGTTSTTPPSQVIEARRTLKALIP